MKKKVQYLLFTLFRIVAYLIFALLIIVCSIAVVEIFKDPSKETPTLVYYSFAVVAVIANGCFSWSRSLGHEHEFAHKIVKKGEMFLLSSMIFLIVSAISYLNQHLEFIQESFHFSFPHVFSQFINIVTHILFRVNIIVTVYHMIRLTEFLVKRNIRMNSDILTNVVKLNFDNKE